MERVEKLYIHDLPDWPNFRWDHQRLSAPLAAVSQQQGRLIGHMEALGFQLRREATLQTLTTDVLKTSEIEGENLDPEQVRSAIARRLGMDIAGLKPAGRHVEGIVEMMLDATSNYQEPLTAERLFAWHAALFPTGRSALTKITVGAWRDDRGGPMQVVSGPVGRETVHYQAPIASRLEREMAAFLELFNKKEGIDPILKAALAHLWFVTIHPFDDGNGRIARAIADGQLARSEDSAQRFYSMSSQIREERKAYYDTLEQTQSGTLDITPWMEWFLACLSRAIARAKETLGAILAKAKFWEALRIVPLNARQHLLINRLLDGFEGNLTTVKWAKIANCSHDTALRDIHDLIAKGVLIQN
ncbi:MAG: Fic family protein, partial [Bryobacteraceae bacterium]